MRFNSEREMQDWLYDSLRAAGEDVQREVVAGAGRADLVTRNAVYELKLELSREGLYQALGQGVTYQRLLGKRDLHLVGHLPIDIDKRQQSLRIAENVRKSGAFVHFIEAPNFAEKQRSLSKKANVLNSNYWLKPMIYFPIILIIAISVISRGILNPKNTAILSGVMVAAIELYKIKQR